jgi:1,4-alpha-glucan branching enzyme
MSKNLLRVSAAALILAPLSLKAAAQQPLGVNYGASETTVQVWAPHARKVELVGEFNGWNPRKADELTLDPATGIWSLALKSQPRGAYRFLVNGQLARRDPWGRAVTADEKSSLFYDPAAFTWKDDAAPAVELSDMVLYELHIGTFADPAPGDGKPGTFYDAVRRLDALAELGVNAVCVMPVHEFPGQQSWGYNPSDLFAVEQAYGGPDGFKTFVKACHDRRIAVHLDVVHNHYGPDNLDLFRFDGTGAYFYDKPGLADTPWGPRPNFDAREVRRYIEENILMWLREYRLDGFRWDSTVNIRAYRDGQHSIPAGAQMLERIHHRIRSEYPGAVSIAEDSLDIGNFHGSWDYDFHHAVMPVLSAREDRDRAVSELARAVRSRPETMWRIIYTDNHDEAGKLNGQHRIASDIDPSNPGGDYARRLSGIGALLTLTAPGIPLLFMGNEMQETGAWHDNTPLNWANWKRNEGLVRLHKDLIALRRSLGGVSGGLKGLEVETPLVDNAKGQLVYWRWDKARPDDKVVVAIHLTRQPAQEMTIPFPAAGTWVARLYTDDKAYGGGSRPDAQPAFSLREDGLKVKLPFAPYSARIFSRDTAAAAPARSVVATAPAVRDPKRPKLTFYESISLSGNFNQWDAGAAPLQLVDDNLWEYRGRLDHSGPAEFRLVGNASTNFWWGLPGFSEISLPFRGTLQRSGKNLVAPDGLSGGYLLRFQENTMELTIDPAAAAGPPPAATTFTRPVLRLWTDQQGRSVEARLLSAGPDRISLVTADGRRLEIPRATLSAEDQAYLETQKGR